MYEQMERGEDGRTCILFIFGMTGARESENLWSNLLQRQVFKKSEDFINNKPSVMISPVTLIHANILFNMKFNIRHT